jgi:hypothetical protein
MAASGADRRDLAIFLAAAEAGRPDIVQACRPSLVTGLHSCLGKAGLKANGMVMLKEWQTMRLLAAACHPSMVWR